MKYIRGIGNPCAKLMIVGEAPGAQEEYAEEAFVGSAGDQVRMTLQEAGLSWGDVYRTNVVKHHPPGDNLRLFFKSSGKKVEDYYPQLWEEVHAIKPNAILALGNVALKALTGKDKITHYRGSILRSREGFPKVIPTIHPASIYKRAGEDGEGAAYSARIYIALDFKRAVTEALTRDFNLPVRSLQICKSSLDLWRFLQCYRDKKRFASDIEVVKAIPICISIAFTPSHGMSIPLLNLDSWKNTGIPKAELVQIWKMLAEFLERPTNEIIGQNWKFDHEKILRTLGIRIPNPYADTSIMGWCLHSEFPKSLEFLTSIYTREPYYKYELKEYTPGRDKIEDLFEYNARDSCVTMECFLAMEPDLRERGLWEYFKYRMNMHRVFLDMEADGFDYDAEAAKELTKKYKHMLDHAQNELELLAGRKVNVRSPKDLRLLLFNEMGFPVRGSTDEDTIAGLWANHAKTPEKRRVLDLILQIRQAGKTISTYLAAKPDYDGRMKTNYRICGTETGRTSTSLLRPPVRPEKIGLTFQNLTKHGDIGQEIRRILRADPGHALLEADLSQAEPRNVGVLSEDWDLLSKFGVVDIHRMTAGWFFGLSSEAAQQMDKEDPRRFIGKTGRNGGNYDMGKRRMAQTINTDAKKYHVCNPGSTEPIQVSEWKAGQILEIFHDRSPKIRGIFHRDIKLALEKLGCILTNPLGQQRQFMGRWDEELFKEAYAWYPQSTVSDQVHRAMIEMKLEMPSIRFTVEAHDNVVVMVKNEPAEIIKLYKLIKYWFEKPIDFNEGSLKRDYKLVIPAEFKIGFNYCDLYDLKLDGDTLKVKGKNGWQTYEGEIAA